LPAETEAQPGIRILAFAPACHPHKGSERGVGWLWSRLAARLGETWVITRAGNRDAIEAALPGIPERDRLHFVYVERPGRGEGSGRGKGRSSLDYLRWQPAALREGRRLHEEVGFDLVWHLTFANAWLGSLAGRVGPPFVYGPVGGGVANPWRLVLGHGVRGVGYEAVRATGRAAGRYLNPLARMAWSRASVILVQNPETREWLPRRHRPKAVVCPNPLLDERFPLDGAVKGGTEGGRSSPLAERSDRGGTALYAGRLVPWKGMFLALRAMRQLPGWRLVVCGKGGDEARLRRLARRLGVADRVDFRGFVAREELLKLMREDADVLLFPSLHDEAGWVVVEARACRLPVVCVARGGPPILGGEGVPATTIDQTASFLARMVERVARADGSEVPVDAGRRWTIPARAEELRTILADAGLRAGRADALQG
jgi:glycosyltransferase involved in cell wall biosynthesis